MTGLDARRQRIADAAMTYVGTPFRLQGRSRSGLDCIGLIVLSLKDAGLLPGDYVQYGLRADKLDEFVQRVEALGFRKLVDLHPLAGDILVARRTDGGLHFLLKAKAGLVESSMACRRVIVRPMVEGETWFALWRLH
ncbi:MAG: hypothetical protein SNJ79_02730 [Sphingomonadaceae bacterium]